MNDSSNVAYAALHTRKHTLSNPFDQEHSGPIVDDVISGLWSLRHHPYFYQYTGSSELPLAELIDFDIVRSELGNRGVSYGFMKDDRDIYRALGAPVITIPDVTDNFTRGILTDAVRATKQKVLSEGRLFADEGRAQLILEKQGLEMTAQQLREIFADYHAYSAFVIGFCFPRLGDAEHFIEKRTDWHQRLKQPKQYIEQLIGKAL